MNCPRYMDGSLVKTTQKYTRNHWKKMFSLWSFELPAKQHRPFGQDGLTGRCCLAGNSKDHKLNIFFSMISSVLLCGFDKEPIHIFWTIHKSKLLFQTTVAPGCTWLAHDLHMTCTWLPNLNPFLRDCSIEKVDIGDNNNKTTTTTQELDKIPHRLKMFRWNFS